MKFDFLRWIKTCHPKELGEFGEKMWKAVFYCAGLNYIPFCELNNGGAPMEIGRAKVILPDFHVTGFKYGCHKSFDMDSKAKRGPVLYCKANEWRHGINRSNWNHYIAFSEEHRRHCCLGIFEVFTDEKNTDYWSGTVLFQSIANLGKPFDGQGSQEHMVFWPRSRFRIVGTVAAPDAEKVIHGRADLSKLKGSLWSILDVHLEQPVQASLFP